jgi:hypothetical protein
MIGHIGCGSSSVCHNHATGKVYLSLHRKTRQR